MRSSLLPLLLATLALGAACRTPTRELPVGWDEEHPQEFATRALALEPGPWSAAAAARLEEAALGRDETSVRAVVLLAQDPSGPVTESLLALLERREVAPARGLEGAEITAAAALADRELTEDQRSRLTALALQPAPHPTLDVRIECAVAALAQGDATVAPLLIRMLRARTPAELEDPPDWEPIDTVAWPKHRAANALARFLGTDDRFRPDGSWQHQMDEAARLEQLLAERGPVEAR